MKFRFVDHIVVWSPWERIQGWKAVSFQEYQLKDVFGDEARLPETLLLESFFQLGNWLILLSSGFQQAGLVVRLSEAKFHGFLRPGETVSMEIRVKRRQRDSLELEGEGRVRDRLIVSGIGCLSKTIPAVDCYDPDDLRVLAGEIGPRQK